MYLNVREGDLVGDLFASSFWAEKEGMGKDEEWKQAAFQRVIWEAKSHAGYFLFIRPLFSMPAFRKKNHATFCATRCRQVNDFYNAGYLLCKLKYILMDWLTAFYMNISYPMSSFKILEPENP